MKRKLTYELYRKTKTKAVNISFAFIMAASTLSGAAPLFLSQKAFADGTVVTSTNIDGWGAQDGNPVIVAGPSGADGSGSLKLTTDTDSKQNFFHSASTPLDGISGLGYKVDVTAGVPASYQLQVTGVHRTDSTSTFTSLVWEPTYNGQTNGPNGGFVTESNLENGTWWSSHPISGDEQGVDGFVPLSQIISANPDAQIVAYGVNIGSGTPNATSYVDDVSFQSSTTNFELDPTLGAENFNTVSDSSYKGISVGFNAKDFSDVSAVTVALKRTDGTTVTMRGTQDLFDLIDVNTAPYQFTAPFVIQAGSYKGDSYWTSDPATWNTHTVPQSVTITVTGTNGTRSVTNASFSQGSPSWPGYSSLVPPAAPTNVHFLTDKSSTLACGSTVNSIYNNKLQFVWTAGSDNSTSYRTLITYPDGGTKWAYTGSRNLWIGNVAQYGYDNGFGEHDNGIYTYAVQAKNANNQWSDSTTCTLAYDTHIPTAHLVTAPADGAHVNGNLTIEADGTDNVALKSLFVDVRSQDGKTWEAGCAGTPVYSSDRKTATLTCTINTSKLTDGTTYMLRAHAGDFAGYGNVNADAVRYFTIDRTLPIAEITSPSANQILSGKTLTIKGSAYDNADFNYYYCYVTLPGSSEVGSRGSDCNTTWHSVTNDTLGTVDLSNLPDGNYEAHLVGYDKAGNHSDFNYAVPFTLDNTAPDVAITNPLAGTTLSYAKDGTVEIRGTVTDTHADHYYLKITGPNGYNAGPHTVKSATSFSNQDLYAWNLKGLQSGDYVIDLEAADALGNKDAGSVQKLHVTVDNTGPDSTNDLPSLVNGTATIHQTITDNTSPASGKLRIWKLDSNGNLDNSKFYASASINVDSNDTVTYVLDSVANLYGDGQYLAKFTSMDTAGNGTVQQKYFTVDNTAPSTPAATPGTGNYEGTQLVRLSSDDNGGSGVASIWYTVDGSIPSDTNGFLYGASSSGFTVSQSETVKAIAYDTAGNASDVLTAVYTITAPTPPIINQGGQVDFTPESQSFSPAVTFGAVRASTLQGGQQSPQGGDTQTDGSGNTDTDVPTGHVKGAHTINTQDNVQNANDKKSATFLGLGWWWLLVLTVIIVVVYLAAGRNSRGKDAS